MKQLLQFYSTLFFTAVFSPQLLQAQCNVNERYDKIISGYHSSIALKDNGTYSVWGSYMQKTGAADQLSPQDINATNYTGLTGTIYKAALGGKNAGAQVDQAILLTSDGLWAWGVVGNVLKSTVKSTATFARITSPTGGWGSTTLGLPTGVAPTDVQSIFATYQTLVLTTKIVNNVGGDVYVLTQTTLAVEANGGTAATAGSSAWQKVKTNSSTYLTNITAVRGQVSNTSYNAFIALSSTGQVYTWGNSTYLGDASAVTARNYATQMTLPAEFSSSIPKMIGVTGGIGTTNTTKNTYYILSNAGNLYSLGDNTQRQCGDFTTTERTSWVQVKKTAAANDYLTNINFFSCQEHNTSYPAIAAITSTGNLYTWGNNSSGMVGRTDDGTASGTLTTASFDPGVPVGFSGTAISVEMGGHTMVYIKEGSTQFCYVGHYTNGSMGDGTSGNNGSSSATVLKHDCNSTPNISICGYVPVAASTATSAISSDYITIVADGSSTANITIQLKDALSNNLTSSGGVVVINTTAGTIGAVTDNNNGTYSAVLTSANAPGTAILSYTINGTAAAATVNVTFQSLLPLTWNGVVAYRQNKSVKIEWTTLQELDVHHFDVERSFNGSNWTVVLPNIAAANLTTVHKYTQTDYDYNTQRLYYRIKETDMNGRFIYSDIVMVSSDNGVSKAEVYPVPVKSSFNLSNINPADIKEVIVLNSNGTKVKSWLKAQPGYDLSGLPHGIYIIRIITNDDNAQYLRITKD